MNAKQRAFIENKLKGVDHQHFANISLHLSHMDKCFNELIKDQKEALCHYFVTCFEIAEAKYIGYAMLVEDASTEEEEISIEREFKKKIKDLEQNRRQYAEQIESVHEKLLDLMQQPFPLDNYDLVYFDEGKMYPREDDEFRSVS